MLHCPPVSGRVRRTPSAVRQAAEDHPTAVAFLDESGAIAQDRHFAVGCLKAADPDILLRAVAKLRDRRRWYGEIHFTDLKPRSLRLYEEVVDVLQSVDVTFSCF